MSRRYENRKKLVARKVEKEAADAPLPYRGMVIAFFDATLGWEGRVAETINGVTFIRLEVLADGDNGVHNADMAGPPIRLGECSNSKILSGSCGIDEEYMPVEVTGRRF
ncbi:hypothetical protein SUGI_0946590 [Cryptomeria japonica]|nr:hypothetical protein SUGI_0946590 [Cryptomeria japonica]